MYKIAMMGDRDSVDGFAAIGLDVYPVEDISRAGKMLEKLADGGYAVIYVVESLCAHLRAEIDALGDRMLPAVIPIPGAFGNTGIGMEMAKKYVERAVGSDILLDQP